MSYDVQHFYCERLCLSKGLFNAMHIITLPLGLTISLFPSTISREQHLDTEGAPQWLESLMPFTQGRGWQLPTRTGLKGVKNYHLFEHCGGCCVASLIQYSKRKTLGTCDQPFGWGHANGAREHLSFKLLNSTKWDDGGPVMHSSLGCCVQYQLG